MSNTIALRKGPAPSLLFIVLLILLAGLLIYWQVRFVKTATDSLTVHLAQRTGIEAPDAVFQEAIRLAAKNLAEELGIDLENYDLTREEYEALVDAAATRFGFCEQYRLYARAPSLFSCYSCRTKPKVALDFGQTYKIGQTCFDQFGRYGKELPDPNLIYKEEFKGNIFEVMVAEQVKLLLFRYSIERQAIIGKNSLLDTELLLPAGNKIFR